MFDPRELFRALEFAHYAERFRDRVFVVALPAGVPLADQLLDIKVLAGYRIGVVLVTQDPDFTLEGAISQANQRGARFELSLVTSLVFDAGALNLDFGRIENTIRSGKTPVIAFHGTAEEDHPEKPSHPVYALAGTFAEILGAQKLVLIHPLTDAIHRTLPRSSVQPGELAALPEALRTAGLEEGAELCGFIERQFQRGTPDVVLIEGRTGDLFREVFTHDGAGILFNATGQARIRGAEMPDVTDIALLLRPEIEAGRIRPVSEDHIERNIHNYWIYEIDGMPVGLACLRHHGDEAEMSQFSTLPRYRGKGRAKELARFLIERARERGYRGVFALSVDERMWEFFLALGFERVARETLPEGWREKYDLSRPSRAFRMVLPEGAP